MYQSCCHLLYAFIGYINVYLSMCALHVTILMYISSSLHVTLFESSNWVRSAEEKMVGGCGRECNISGVICLESEVRRPHPPAMRIPARMTPLPGGGGTASLKVGTHCQTTAPAFWHCPPLNLFLPPPIFEGHRPPPPKIKHSL